MKSVEFCTRHAARMLTVSLLLAGCSQTTTSSQEAEDGQQLKEHMARGLAHVEKQAEVANRIADVLHSIRDLASAKRAVPRLRQLAREQSRLAEEAATRFLDISLEHGDEFKAMIQAKHGRNIVGESQKRILAEGDRVKAISPEVHQLMMDGLAPDRPNAEPTGH
jgi:hypothetical protein